MMLRSLSKNMSLPAFLLQAVKTIVKTVYFYGACTSSASAKV